MCLCEYVVLYMSVVSFTITEDKTIIESGKWQNPLFLMHSRYLLEEKAVTERAGNQTLFQIRTKSKMGSTRHLYQKLNLVLPIGS